MSATSRIDWPDGKDFAFTIFDDTDLATLENVPPVYELLGGLGFTVLRVGVAKSQAAATAVMAAVKTIQPPAEPVNQSTNPPGN